MCHYYECKNERCEKYGKIYEGNEKICPFCGTETNVYFIEMRNMYEHVLKKALKVRRRFIVCLILIIIVAIVMDISFLMSGF